ncbi:hypothetical protein BOX15_Mlig027869g3 [Macrostomum lignano]|uniref:Uncharacterized protein n=1 Tax=Macrostomum lignano TaxID=282301 RepID=A0A267G7T2_9PLAT|nr:hypothetical protein BOX15_Mlig027869g3 [Macrostomum lignano]
MKSEAKDVRILLLLLCLGLPTISAYTYSPTLQKQFFHGSNNNNLNNNNLNNNNLNNNNLNNMNNNAQPENTDIDKDIEEVENTVKVGAIVGIVIGVIVSVGVVVAIVAVVVCVCKKSGKQGGATQGAVLQPAPTFGSRPHRLRHQSGIPDTQPGSSSTAATSSSSSRRRRRRRRRRRPRDFIPIRTHLLRISTEILPADFDFQHRTEPSICVSS